MNYTKDFYIIIYFFYGLSFFSLGLLALTQKTLKESDLRLIEALKYLGFFGIIHGFSEWLIMLIIWNAYPNMKLVFIFLVLILNIISYIFIWFFGVYLFEKVQHRRLKKLLVFFFGIWLMVLFLIVNRTDSILTDQMVNVLIISRNIFGFPSAVLSSIGLYKKHLKTKNINFYTISNKLLKLSLLFFIYGIFTGLITEPSDILLSMYLNSNSFLGIFKIPVEVPRGLLALMIAFSASKLISVFMLEAEIKIEKLKNHQLKFNERRVFANQLHDEFIQNLFAIGLMLDSLSVEENDFKKKKQMKSILDESIKKTRGFIEESLTKDYSIFNLVNDTEELIEKLKLVTDIKIEFRNELPELNIGDLSPEFFINIFYILKEGINNAVKHSDGSYILIDFSSDIKHLKIVIEDNGKGLCIDNMNQYSNHGLTFIKKRSKDIHGDLQIINKSKESGLKLELEVPWEV